jgi:mono/diheme cytochrome c family protein
MINIIRIKGGKMPLAIRLLLTIGVAFFGLNNLNAASTDKPKGIGPITEIKLDPLDTQLATHGKEIFLSKCSACHKMEERYVGPALKGITSNRSPEWIMNMILNPIEMTQKDPDAKALFEEYLMQMTFQNVSDSDSRSILEYFRHYDEKGELISAKAQNKKTNEKPNKKKNKK